MEVAWDDWRTRQFATNVGLISSDGPHGPNLMAAEWTRAVSYAPALIMLNINARHATADNIIATKKFGVSLAAEDQNILASVAGSSSGKQVDKVAALKEAGAEFYKGKTGVLLVKGAIMTAECRVVRHEALGDHIVFVGEVVELVADENKKPLIYHAGRYWKLGEAVRKPSPQEREKLEAIVLKHSKAKGE